MSYTFNSECTNYFNKFIDTIKYKVRQNQNTSQNITLFLDPQTELAELKFEYFDENSEFREIYGGTDSNMFKTVVELFQWTTSSLEFSFMDYDTIEQIKKVLTEYLMVNLPEYKDEIDYCYAIIELK